jgi:alpha-galactosidase
VWVAQSAAAGGHYLAVFNLTESSQIVQYAWRDLGFTRTKYKLRDLWGRKDLGPADSVVVTLPRHGSVLYEASPVGRLAP